MELAIGDNPKMKALDIEIKRSGNTYTYETLQELKDQYPEHDFYFIIGADCLFSIESWYHAEKIFELCHLLVARRDGKTRGEMRKKARELKEKYHAKVHLMEFEEMEISSTKIREEIKAGRDAADLLPKAVALEIQKKKYFRD